MDAYARMLGANIRMLRVNRQMSVRQLCNAADVSETALRYYEDGKSEPTAHAAARLARALGVSCDVLLMEVDR